MRTFFVYVESKKKTNVMYFVTILLCTKICRTKSSSAGAGIVCINISFKPPLSIKKKNFNKDDKKVQLYLTPSTHILNLPIPKKPKEKKPIQRPTEVFPALFVWGGGRMGVWGGGLGLQAHVLSCRRREKTQKTCVMYGVGICILTRKTRKSPKVELSKGW